MKLWTEAIGNYWRDPRNIIGPPGALVRRMIKLTWLALSVYVLFWVAGPSQVASWQLWMEDDKLAYDIAWAFTFAAALCFAVVGYVAEQTNPVRVPIFIPKLEGSWKNLRLHSTHVHVPNIRVTLGVLLAAALFVIALLGQWNYYLHDNLSTGGASVAAIEGSTSRVTEAEGALSAHDASTIAALGIIDQGIRETSAGSPTGRSRLVAQRAALTTEAAAVRRELAEDLRAARAATVTVRSTSTDPRPVDGQVAAATGADRGLVSSLLDLLRSGVVEALLVMGAGLGLAGAVSRVGVPKDEASFAGAVDEEVRVEPTQAAPEDPAPEPPPRRRFVLPSATAEDYEQAVAVGPHAATSPVGDDPVTGADEPVAEEPPVAPTQDAPAADFGATPPVDEIDPLLAAELEGAK